MTEWKPPFDRGISNFRSGKYDEALVCFNEVCSHRALFHQRVDWSITVRNERRNRFPTIRLARCRSREAWGPQGRSRGRTKGHRPGTTPMAGLRKMRETLLTNEEARTRREDGGLRVGTRQARRHGAEGNITRSQTRGY